MRELKCFSELRGSHAHRLFEQAHEVYVILIAARLGNSGYGHIGGREQIFGVSDAAGAHVRGDICAKEGVIEMLDVRAVQVYFLADPVYIPIVLR